MNSVELLERLVAFESISHASNLDISDFIARFAEGAGGAVTRFRSSDQQKEALLVRVGPTLPGGIILSSHMDVVPTEGQHWATDPFRLRVADGRLYGRGAVDMKGFLSLSLSVAASLDAKRLRRPLYLAISYDEETTCSGVRPLVDHIHRGLPAVASCIVGEPTEMRVVGAHKGAVDWAVEIKGKAAHTSIPSLGANAIHAAAAIVNLIEEIADEFAQRPFDADGLFDVPYTSVSVSLIQGGSAPNIVPDYCRLHIEARPLKAGDDDIIISRVAALVEHTLLPRLRRTAPDAEIKITEIDAILPLIRHPHSAAELLLSRVSGSKDVEAVSYATEAGFFQAAGIPTVVFGPGSIRQAHQPDEFIELKEFKRGESALQYLVNELY